MNWCSRVLMTGAAALLGASAVAAETPAVQAVWQPRELTFQYMGFTTAYDCDALADKVEQMLQLVGARAGLRVSAGGCATNRPERSIAVRIAALMPVPQGEQVPTADLGNEQRAELLKRLGIEEIDSTPFAATWQNITLPKERSSPIGSGDCELLAQMRDRVFPQLNIKVVQDRARCTPHQASLVPASLAVSALLPVKSADARKTD